MRTRVFIVALALFGAVSFIHTGSCAYAETSVPGSSYAAIDLSEPKSSCQIQVKISRAQSEAYHWKSGQMIRIRAFVDKKSGGREFVRDDRGRKTWNIRLDQNLEGSAVFFPDQKTFSGRLTVLGDSKIILATTPYLAESSGLTLEKVLGCRFRDGAALRIHYTDQILEEAGVTEEFPREVLEAAVMAYQTITQFEGFNSSGFSFANPNRSYAYDPDKTLDIYLGNPAAKNSFKFHGFTSQSFHDAPCFDTLKHSETSYDAVILLPANYTEFIKNWEKLNPSTLGPRNINLDLRGTLIHEMLHSIIFYYNKNLNRETSDNGGTGHLSTKSAGRHLDWYVEGLARYFETFAGARHDFYSQGFKETLPDKIRFSRGGSNFFMRYPDQAFTELRYENALFWRYLDYQFGMKVIEALSREFRGSSDQELEKALEKTTGLSFKELLKKFSLAILFKDFGLKEDAKHLKEVARTRLSLRKNGFYLRDGFDGEKMLGRVCRTDWVGRWDDARAKEGEATVAGDNTLESDVSAWATDYFEIEVEANLERVGAMELRHLHGGKNALVAQLVLETRGGSMIYADMRDIASGSAGKCELDKILNQNGLTAKDLAKVYLLITNLDREATSGYEVAINT